MNEKTQKVLKAYCRRGWKLFPIIPETKRPAIKDNLNKATDDMAQLIEWAERFPGCNWAVACARSGLVAVDVDFKHGGVEAWDAMLESHGMNDEVLPDTLQATSGSGARHYLFKAKEGVKYRGKIKDGIDIKFNGYVVVFPSIHPDTGKRYTWNNWKTAEPLEYPEWLGKYIEKTALKGRANPTYKFGDDYLGRLVQELKKHELDYNEWVQAGMALHAADPSDKGLDLFVSLSQGESYVEGDEEKAAEKWASFGRSKDDDAISPLTLGFLVRQKGGTVPNPHFESDKEAFKRAKIDSFENWVETNEAEEGFVEDEDDRESWVCTNRRAIVNHFNKKGFAYLGEGEQRFSIIKVSKDGSGVKKLKAMTSRGMVEATAEYQYKYIKVMATDVKLVKEPAAETWLKSKNKRRFVTPVFDPGEVNGESPKGRINLFDGIPCERLTRPTTSSDGLDEFLKMIRESLCGGDENASEWLLDYLAHIIQRPDEKPTVVPVIVGPQGTGKGLLFDHVMRGILKDLFLTVKTAKDLTAQFNMDLANRLLTVIDEATWRGNKTEDGVLKNLTGGNKLTVEVKFGPKYETENFSRYAITSNNEEAVAIETSNRRYYPIESSDEFAGNSDYFNPIWDAYRRGDLVPVFFMFLQDRDISKWNPVAIPAGNLKGSAAKLGTGGVYAGFWNALLTGDFEPSREGFGGALWFDANRIKRKDIYNAFLEYAKMTNAYERALSPEKFWLETKKKIPFFQSARQEKIGGGRGYRVTPTELAESFFSTMKIEIPENFSEIALLPKVDFSDEEPEPDFEGLD
jgi:hypothetical protein